MQNQISELTAAIKTQAENIQTQQALTAGTIQLKLEKKEDSNNQESSNKKKHWWRRKNNK